MAKKVPASTQAQGDLARVFIEHAESEARQTRLDLVPHFVPLNLEALEITLKHILIINVEDTFEAREIRDQLSRRLANKDRVETDEELIKEAEEEIRSINTASLITIEEFKNSVEEYVKKTNTKPPIHLPLDAATGARLLDIKAATPARVIENGKIVGVLYSGYDSASRSLFTTFLNKQMVSFIKERSDKMAKSYKKRFNVGHILDPKAASYDDPARSPLLLKLKEIEFVVSQLAAGKRDLGGIPGFSGLAGVSDAYIAQNKANLEALLSNIRKAFDDLSKVASYGTNIKAVLSKEVTSLLNTTGGIVVVIQEEFENVYQFGTLIEGPFGARIVQLLLQEKYSDSIDEELDKRLFHAAKTGKLLPGTGKKTKTQNIELPKIKPSIKVTTSKTSRTVRVPNSVKSSIRTKTGQFYSLTSLQSLLDSLLVLTIKQNMGDGTRRDILNLRSGRLAESVKVERMSQSREGMITIFYTYMKNPYATFSDGGRQELPKTRDPKLLIAKSIREIAAQKVANKLRAVSL